MEKSSCRCDSVPHWFQHTASWPPPNMAHHPVVKTGMASCFFFFYIGDFRKCTADEECLHRAFKYREREESRQATRISEFIITVGVLPDPKHIAEHD